MSRPTLSEFSSDRDFLGRHIGPTIAERELMLGTIGMPSLDALLEATVPTSIRIDGLLPLPPPRTETDVLDELRSLARRNQPRVSLIGQGYYGTVCPPVIQRNVLENPAWYTAYTPYQPEISQGRLEALLTFQTMIEELTGFELANASLLDEATAAAEAMTMARRTSKVTGQRFFVHHDTHPQTIAVLRTRAQPIGIDIVVGDIDAFDQECFGLLISLPTSTGAVPDWRTTIEHAHASGAIVVVATDLLACVLTTPPGHLGADIAIGSAQRFGVPMGFGGPHAAFLATGEAMARSLPGRLVGVSTDTEGRPALRLALQTREQHIRREKATSNICTAQVLLANMAAFYGMYHGPDGLTRIARRVHRLTDLAAAALRAAGCTLEHDTWFDTLCVRGDADAMVADARAAGINLRRVDAERVSFSIDETTAVEVVERVVALFGAHGLPADDGIVDGMTSWRADEFLTQSVFHRHHT
ncbi:MAG: glycine dehydrogenase, partial [Actinomycetota bacterium]